MKNRSSSSPSTPKRDDEIKGRTATAIAASVVLILSFVAAAQLMAASSSVAYAQTTSFPNPPPPTTITEANCSPVDTGGAQINVKIENLYLDDGYEYTLESSIEGAPIRQNDLFYQEGDPIEYTGSESPLEYPIAFYTKQLTFKLQSSDIVNLGEEYIFKLYQTNVDGAQVFHSVTITCDTTPPPPPPVDTDAPLLTVPDPITVQATTANGGTVVTYAVTAEDVVDGTATLKEDGVTITQDDVGGEITISCDRASGTEFPIGETPVDCKATDAAGNTRDASFTITVNPPPPPNSTPAEATTELISDVENLEDNVPQGTKTSLTAPLRQASTILTDDNPNNDKSACSKLDAFINQVNAAETRGTLTEQQATDLRTQAADIRTDLGC